MNRVVVIGAGFGGLSLLKQLSKSGLSLNIVAIDKKKTFDFLPLLPDVIGRGISPQFLTYSIEEIAKRNKFEFINLEITSVNLDKREVLAPNFRLNYDYLVIASGSETNFYGNDAIERYGYTLDNVRDAEKLLGALSRQGSGIFLIGGGGYTGIELAANLSLFLEKNKKNNRIIILERSPSILWSLPEWIKDYAGENLKKMGIEIYLDTTIAKIEGKKVYLSGGMVFDNALVIWAAGVRTANFIQDLEAKKNPQGRLLVDDSLRLDQRCFVIGDAAYFSYRGISLRMAVQFALTEASCAAMNIINSIKGRKLARFIPQDLGYIIPLANNHSCGRVFSLNLSGRLPTLFHFLMCIYRSYGFKNRMGLISAFFSRTRSKKCIYQTDI